VYDPIEDELGELEKAMAINSKGFEDWEYDPHGYGWKYPMDYRRTF